MAHSEDGGGPLKGRGLLMISLLLALLYLFNRLLHSPSSLYSPYWFSLHDYDIFPLIIVNWVNNDDKQSRKNRNA